MLEKNELEIIELLKEKPDLSSKEIFEFKSSLISYATTKRILIKLINQNILRIKGNGKSRKYFLSPLYKMVCPIDMDTYFEKEIDERIINDSYNFQLISDLLQENSIFTTFELNELNQFQNKFENNILQLSALERRKELERLAIDLSWKSSQIEGNTYSLLETERLLLEKETAAGKTKEEAIMLLNHKDAIDFIIEHPDYIIPLKISKIEDIHSFLIKELIDDKRIRKSRVGVSGTNYRPLDNDFQIQEALTNMCNLVNYKDNIFEKALLVLLLISYIQPFVDGNKRTARIVSNAILINYNYCPISFRTVDSLDYKKAMLLFYEQNNISNFKKIFIEQYKFAVNSYF